MPKSMYQDDKADRRKDVSKATKKPKLCPTCGKPYSASTQGGGGVGGAAGGGGGG